MLRFIKSILAFSALYTASAVASVSPSQAISYSDVGIGKPIILIHPFPADQTVWQSQKTELAKHFRVITLDLWGFGKSPATHGQAIKMEEYADEVKQLLDKLHIQKAIIAGESMGGYITLAFLEKYPNQVEGLVLSNTQAIADTAETQAKRETTANDLLEHGTANFISGFLPKALSSLATQETKTFLLHIMETQTPEAMASALRGMALRKDTSSILSNTNLPVLIITSDQDMVIPPQQSTKMHELARNSKLVVLAHSGHLSNLEQPQQWNEAVVEYFKGN
jgi:pimeloyl-ACP methyl ester carboxylesterase